MKEREDNCKQGQTKEAKEERNGDRLNTQTRKGRKKRKKVEKGTESKGNRGRQTKQISKKKTRRK